MTPLPAPPLSLKATSPNFIHRSHPRTHQLLHDCSMKCINCQSLPAPLLAGNKNKHQIWLASKPSSVQTDRKGFILGSLWTRAVPSPIFLASDLPATGKLSVLLQTSAVCLFAYWVANFVVPGIILKDLQSKDRNDDGESSAQEER